MLINFRVENFLSFNQLATFSMTPGKTKIHQGNLIKSNQIDLLKFSGIYGANASGKSNIVNAIGFSQLVILEGLKNRSIFKYYNRNGKDNKNKQTSFEYDIKIAEKLYSYGFSIKLHENRIEKEWLYDVTDKEIMIFTREKVVDINQKYLDLSVSEAERLAIYAEDILEANTDLFLTELNKRKKIFTSNTGESIFRDVFNWFRNTLEVISPEDMASGFDLSYQEGAYLTKLGEFLQQNDTGIDQVKFEDTQGRIKDVPIDIETKIKDQIISSYLKRNVIEEKQSTKYGVILRTPNNIYSIGFEDDDLKVSELKFIHGSEEFNFDEESDGTIRLIELFSILINKNEKVFVVDELDRSLHPLLTYNFVQSFLVNQKNSQLVVTTHEDRLLDLNLLRRDQIWFVEKDKDGNSKLYSLEEYKTRFDKNIMNAYLDGRYGGIPDIDDLFEELLKDEVVI